MVTDRFVLFVDPYHKQVYQLPTDSDDETVVRGVAMPTYAQFPASVVADTRRALVYWVDSAARRIVASHFTDNTHTVLAQLPTGIAKPYLLYA